MQWSRVFAGSGVVVPSLVLLVLLAFHAAPVAGLGLPDADADGVPDESDNCVVAQNPDQTDSDCDSYGNACDSDFNNDGVTNGQDIVLWGAAQPSSFALFDVAPPFNGVPDGADSEKVEADLLSLAPPGPTGLPGPGCTKNLGAVYYCVEGTGTGTAYSWSVFSDIGGAIDFEESPAPAGANAYRLMLNLVNALNAGLAAVPIKVVDIELRDGLACFSLDEPSAELRVGVASTFPNCLVNSISPYCQYNPSIYQVLSAKAPALSIAGLIALTSLLAGSCAFVLRRRHAGRE